VPILLQKFFWSDGRNFSGPLMRFARGDMRDHIVSHKNDHEASYWRYGILRWRSWLKINICEIFGVVRFSTFATISAKLRRFGNRTNSRNLGLHFIDEAQMMWSELADMDGRWIRSHVGWLAVFALALFSTP
jgi:hypothetical protein